MKYSVRGDEASRGVLSEIRGLLSAQEKLVMTSPLRNPLFRSYRNRSFRASRSASRIMSKNLSDGVLDTLNIRPASSKDTRRAAKTMTANSPNFPTSLPVSSARFTISFSRSDNRSPFLSNIRFTSSSDRDRTPIFTPPHSGHFTTFDRSFTVLISEYFQHDVQTSVLASLYKRAFADSTKMLFIFSVGIKSVRRLIRSSPTRTIGLGLAFPLFTITLTSPVPMPAKTLLVFGMSTSFSKVSLIVSSLITVFSKLFAHWR